MAELPTETPQQLASRRALELKRASDDADDGLDDVRLLDTRGTAALLGCSTNFLEHARLRGDGPDYLKMSPGVRGIVRYSVADLRRWVNARRQRSTAENGTKR